jgi:acetyl-CoA C-acetyltransferase
VREVVIVDALRTPFGKRNGDLSTMHAIDLLGVVQRSLFERTGVDPAEIGQVVGGCANQVGMQSMNVTRTAWLTAGLPSDVAQTTVDSRCGSSQQATSIAFSLVAAGVVESAVACGVEIMSRVPMGSATPKDPDVGRPLNRNYARRFELTSQLEGAERIAKKYGVTRAECDELGKRSQDRAADAWAKGLFSSQTVPVDAPDLGGDGKPTGVTHRVEIDEGLRDTTIEALAKLKPANQSDGVHTAGTSSQVSDGAAALLLMTAERAKQVGVTPLAKIVDVALVGCDPVLMLEGPIPATRDLLRRNKLTMRDIDVTEINEAFASVVLAWAHEVDADMERVNPNGGAIALGHPLGASGAALIAKAAHELVRSDGENALVTMCCGGGLGAGTLLQRA